MIDPRCIISYASVTLTLTSLQFSNSPGASPSLAYTIDKTKPLAPVFQKLDSATHRINHYAANKYYQKQLCYPLDSDSAIQRLNNPGLVRFVCEPTPKSLFWASTYVPGSLFQVFK